MFKKKYYLVKVGSKKYKELMFYLFFGTSFFFALYIIIFFVIPPKLKNNLLEDKPFYNQRFNVEDRINALKHLNLSKLGEILFLYKDYIDARKEQYKILIWKDGPFLEKRHIRSFSDKIYDPFDDCSVNNCAISYKDEDLMKADAVVFLLLRQQGVHFLPDPSVPRPPNQRWIFLTDENPQNTFLHKTNNWKNYAGVFNWSMTYRMESDIPVPYGRVIPLKSKTKSYIEEASRSRPTIPNIHVKQRNVLVATMLTNCSKNSPFMKYVTEMQTTLDVHIYGACGNVRNTCSQHFAQDCPHLSKYLFYLSFEMANCKEYLTQKLWNSYSKGAIPIIVGSSVKDCLQTLPPGSFINSADYGRPGDLARHIIYINSTDNQLTWFHNWRATFAVVNEHGYFGSRSYHYCRICQALNYNDEAPKVYDELSYFLSPQNNCIQNEIV